jgi:hypothetical protein
VSKCERKGQKKKRKNAPHFDLTIQPAPPIKRAPKRENVQHGRGVVGETRKRGQRTIERREGKEETALPPFGRKWTWNRCFEMMTRVPVVLLDPGISSSQL